MRIELEHVTEETQRWKSRAVQLSQESEAWRAGHIQGRADLLAMVPLLVAAAQNQATCTKCGETNGAKVERAVATLPPG
jgi:hypothetical protein